MTQVRPWEDPDFSSIQVGRPLLDRYDDQVWHEALLLDVVDAGASLGSSRKQKQTQRQKAKATTPMPRTGGGAGNDESSGEQQFRIRFVADTFETVVLQSAIYPAPTRDRDSDDDDGDDDDDDGNGVGGGGAAAALGSDNDDDDDGSTCTAHDFKPFIFGGLRDAGAWEAHTRGIECWRR